MIPITQKLLTNHNRPGKKLIKLKGVAIHWTANTGKKANAEANRNFFQNTVNSASAHYVVDDRSIIECVPDGEVAYHVGAKKYTSLGMKFTQGTQANDGIPFYSPNFFLIGIEICVNEDGNWAQAYKNAVELAAYLLKEHGLTVNDLYRHNDITGKNCPALMTTPALWDAMVKELKASGKSVSHLKYCAWDEFKNEVNKKMNESTPKVAPAAKAWEQTTGEKAIDELVKKGKLSNGDTWKVKDLKNEPTPLWLFFEMMNRIGG
jgi:N-acetylmuramoyl-L-alanine amidase CwlA